MLNGGLHSLQQSLDQSRQVQLLQSQIPKRISQPIEIDLNNPYKKITDLTLPKFEE